MDLSMLVKRLMLSGLSACELIQIFENIEDAIYITGRNTELLYMNRASEELFGLTLEEMRGKKNNEINGRFERWYPSVLLDSYKEKKRYTQEQYSTYSGKKFHTTLIPVLEKDGTVSMVVAVSRVLSYTVEEIYQAGSKTNVLPEGLFGPVITNSACMLNVLSQARKAARHGTTILLTGETGTGKNLIAKYIHDSSPRKDNPFIMVNCSTIPANIIEAELFGYAPHTFSGADPKGKSGLIAAAEGGTIFLDEIGELTLELQPKILGFLQSQTYMLVGGRKEIHSDVRIIAATNKNLKEEMEHRRFRSDLYYRLSVLELYIPPLRERSNDIPLLAKYFLQQSCEKYDLKKAITEGALEILTGYRWPGNIRQLKNFMEKLSVIVETEVIHPNDVAFIEAAGSTGSKQQSVWSPQKPEALAPISLEEEKSKLERQLVTEAFARFKTCRLVAQQLQISTTKAHKLYHQYCDPESLRS